MAEFDYKKLGLLCGLEIHQQLNSKSKLFCRCPNELQGTRDPDFVITRYMRPVLGEMGTYDEAMLTEYEKGMTIVYECYDDVICTYELDETPPFFCDDEARKIAIEIASLLNSHVIEEMHVCRKNYLDGSVPCGFQRTMILAKDGNVELENGKRIRIDIICLEEDAARKVRTENQTNYYRLDRLGIPLVEITTKPDINDPNECRECAERLGLLLWSTSVKKVLGSIRQDINVSIKAGTRVEIKGVQKLDWIPILINHEVSRQIGLVEIKNELEQKQIKEGDLPNSPIDLSKEINKDSSNFIAKGIKSGKKLFGVNFKGFEGIFGKVLMENYRFGTEVSSKVKSITGLKGLIHSDEDLKKYKFPEADLKKIKTKLNFADNDCFVLVLGTEKEVNKAIKVAIKRVRQAFKGVPPETRKALDDGNTEFLRELHGGARLYPDTDSQAIINPVEDLEEIQKSLPELPWKVITNYAKKYKLEERLIKELIFTGKLDLFNKLLSIYEENPILVITTLLETTTALRRDGKNVDSIQEEDFIQIFNLLKSKQIGKEAIEDIMSLKADKPNLSVEQIKADLNIESVSADDLKSIINTVLTNNSEMLKEKEMRAMGPLMGIVMKEVRGKIDGKVVSDELKKAIISKLKELK